MAQSTFNASTGLAAGLSNTVGQIGANPLFQGSSSGGANYLVGASVYSEESGSCGISPNNVYGFAELGPAPAIGKALGGLPCGTQVKLRNPANGKTVLGTKIDIGKGGGPVEGLTRRIDLTPKTAQALGINGLGKLEIETASGQKLKNVSFEPLELLPPPLGPLIPGAPNVGEILKGESNLNPLAPVEGLANGIKEFIKRLGAFFKFFELISTPAGWLRIGKVLIGAALLLIALAELAKVGSGSTSSSVPSKLTGIGKEAAIGAVL